ncbi:centrosomal protein cep57l1 [Xenopus tropicalis]|uniref:Centrosomal protein cep57l1 n=1 Tax=Xenopus tropicalis TaxID=8364 RepID=CE57L_XENTR|nr:centrosomal protein cep57l1 [Xenopus tropicalis]Q28BZ7.1 RecName: Full=Centrosomal protein cep57l1; AltName: Full=Centrosomal protein 57kDa-like protein 1; AltName: Full=Centrosomal protein of 57 kDa; Short=Cep57; AltName: Full=Cep57-related protein; Short=Cep57R [Xenopus tropicalis]CAJ82055.1 novel protein [Xenopus tropicalis]|eukprot:NP_001039145.1 centrosomal protein cep57l1 [Xenopus tropicalis]
MESLSKESYLSSFHQFPSYAPLPDHIKFESVSSKKIQCSALENISPHQYDILQAPNSRALISALKTLQEKICRLELEKTHARDRLTNLTRVAGEHKKVLESEKQSAELAAKEATNQQNDIGKQLNNAKQRCSLLEKQLDYMKEMMENADTQKTTIHEHQMLTQKEQKEIQSKLKKLEVLEKMCTRLSATHKSAETKIQHLEEKLSVEEQNRKALQDKAAQVQTSLEVNRILLSSASAQNSTQRKVKKKKQSKLKNSVSKEPPSKCFYPKAGELPFVAGKSTTSSHSLSANVQNVLHMMKHHSPQVSQKNPKTAEHKPSVLPGGSRTIPTRLISSFTGDNLSDILLALQDELGQMSFEHQELLRHINETKNTDMREDLERELDYVVKQMEIKSDQIMKLKRHQLNVNKLKKTAKLLKEQPRPTSVTKLAADKQNTGAKDPSTPRRKGDLADGSGTPNSKASLELLKSVRKIQMTLKKDDIMWEK